MISVVSRSGIAYPPGDEFFSPSERYPEYKLGAISTIANPVYELVRRAFHDAGLDRERSGTSAWNPLGEHIRPGSSVFVLCNFVYHRRPQESVEDFQSKCIHGSVLRALLDYVLIAAGPSGRIRFGNAPLQSCVWERVLADTGADRVAAFYRQVGLPVEAADLRMLVTHRTVMGRVTAVDHRDASGDAIEIDLGADSLLAELACNGAPPRFRVSDYDPRRIEAFHAGGSHRYVLHREILESDTIVSLPKLKTHEKVGITCGLKGFVGTVAHKDCLAHHRFGSPEQGGDEYERSFGVLHGVSVFSDWINRRPPGSPLQGPLQIAERVVRRAVRAVGLNMAGAWYGNDTAWRMTLDLARIVHYADRNGVMRETPQRRHLALIDGIIGGQGNGPLAPDPIRSGVLVFGDSIVDVDRVAARLMGFSPTRIRLLTEPERFFRYPLPSSASPFEVSVDETRVASDRVSPLGGRGFRPPSGWRGRLDGLR